MGAQGALPSAGPNGISRAIVAGQSAGKAKIYRGDARFDSVTKFSFRFGGCNLRGTRSCTVSDVVVELLGRYGLIEIVLVCFAVDDVVEIDQLNAFLLNELQWKITTGVDDEVALGGHKSPFERRQRSARWFD